MGKLEPQMLSYIERVYSTGVYKKKLNRCNLVKPCVITESSIHGIGFSSIKMSFLPMDKFYKMIKN